MSDKMRKEFEKWIKKETGFDVVRTRFPMTSIESQQYLSHNTNLAWFAWQASRAALVVDLPPTCCRTLIFEQENTLEVGMEHGEYYDPDDLKEAPTEAGIRHE